MKVELLNIDCIEYMSGVSDNAFELAIVDPPYGIGFGEFNRTNITGNGVRVKADKYKNGQWDAEIPSPEYFSELIRCSKQQIIWGGNYFPSLWEKGCKGFIYWHKGNPVPNFGDGELAWTSFNKPCKQFNYKYYGNLEGNTSASDKIHPTQKPVALYRWLLHNYASPGDRILDTHGGSRSLAIACHQMGFDHVSCEIDKDYHDASVKRYNNAIMQQSLF